MTESDTLECTFEQIWRLAMLTAVMQKQNEVWRPAVGKLVVASLKPYAGFESKLALAVRIPLMPKGVEHSAAITHAYQVLVVCGYL